MKFALYHEPRADIIQIDEPCFNISVDEVKDWGNVLEHVGPENFIPRTDCGMMPRSRFAAEGKMRSLAAGTALVNRRNWYIKKRSTLARAG